MQKRSVAENSMKRSLDAVLQEVLDILEADDGKSFEEKKEAAVNRLRTCQDEFVAETLADFAVADIVGLQLQTSSGNPVRYSTAMNMSLCEGFKMLIVMLL